MKARFSGHDTFPLRYGWLYKAVNHLNSNGKLQTSNDEKTRDAIVELGVGKNMVNAIRYWAEATALLKSSNNQYTTSKLGNYLFNSETGRDPFLEQIGSVWLVHFWLNFNYDTLNAYRYFFNYSHVQHFEKSKFINDCHSESKTIVVNDVGNESTIKKDIDCFLHTYTKKFKSAAAKKKQLIDEEHFNSPLAELNLVQDLGAGFFVSDLKERPELPIEVFIYALICFAKNETKDSNVNYVDFDSLLSKPYSPGRIFRLSESGLGQKLDEAQEYSENSISWVDSLGLRQVQISKDYLGSPELVLNEFYGGDK